MSSKNRNKNTFWAKFTGDLDEVELSQPDCITVFKVIWNSTKSFFKERPGQIISTAFILIMLWGTHGKLELLKSIWLDWRGPGTDPASRPKLISFVPWDHELISFWVGAFLLVLVPMLIIKYGFKQPLRNYGLGLPPKSRRALAVWTFLTLTLLSLPAFWLATNDPSMRAIYPLYRGEFANIASLALYEITYLPFFIAIEFIFRGYLLFGLAGVQDDEIKLLRGGFPGVFYFHRYALLIQMLSYTAWHLGKPLSELWGTLIWGLAAGATAYAVRSIWPIVLSHWLLNIVLDALIWQTS